ncbi:MAG: DNA methylase [Erysipelotrichaceae bacterium]|nr:DNA methylase [Erysipelotrichaceae bacterium]
MSRTYIAIDLKSFYASAECVLRGLNPLNTNLVVADKTRTEKTICLAVSPSLKALGVSSRPRLFEVISVIDQVNAQRRKKRHLYGKSVFYDEILKNDDIEVSFLIAPPQMKYYMDLSNKIYEIYLKYISSEDIHVYSIDEVFMDVTDYLNTYDMTAEKLAMTIIKDVLENTGITATAGIGTNLYLAKVAMDIVAKHKKADENGVRIASIDEMSYRRLLWDHRPLRDFWRVGKGYSKKLEELGLFTMGDIARFSIENEEVLYRIFGVNTELLIDHAWGYEPCTMKEIKKYRPENSSIGTSQVFDGPKDYQVTGLIIKEMADNLALELTDKGLYTDSIVLTVGYDIINLDRYSGETTKDRYGRTIPKHAHGTVHLDGYTLSSRIIVKKTTELYERIAKKDLYARRVSIAALDLRYKYELDKITHVEEYSLFDNVDEKVSKKDSDEKELLKDLKIQESILKIKKKYGKNSILRGMNLEDGATAVDRNKQIGGHKA